jgi:hypothetical protein
MSYIVGKNTKRIDLENGQWIDIKMNLPYIEIEPLISKMQNKELTEGQMILELIKIAVVSWHLLDDEGQEILFDKEKVSLFTVSLVTELSPIVSETYFLDKKKDNQLEK